MSTLTIAAINYANATMRVAAAKEALDTAYYRWKKRHDVGHIERDDPDWKRMMRATSNQYMELKRAKSQQRYWSGKLVKLAKEVAA